MSLREVILQQAAFIKKKQTNKSFMLVKQSNLNKGAKFNYNLNYVGWLCFIFTDSDVGFCNRVCHSDRAQWYTPIQKPQHKYMRKNY